MILRGLTKTKKALLLIPGSLLGGLLLFGVSSFVPGVSCEVSADSHLPDFVKNCPVDVAPPATEFDIQQSWETGTITQAYQTPIVGDLYGTGEPVAVMAGRDGSGGVQVYDRRARDLHIVNGADGELINTIDTPFHFTWSGHSVVTIADLDGDGEGEIVVKAWYHTNDPAEYRGRLVAYKNDGTEMWVSNERYDYDEPRGRGGASLSVADFNADGTPEIYVGNQIFNGATGERLMAGTSTESSGCPYTASVGCFWSQTTAADMDNDGKLELIAGDTVYKVDITNPNGETGNSLSTWQQADSTVPGVGDGWTAVADMDLDGTPDVVVVRTDNAAQSGQTRLYVWNGQTNEVKSMMTGIGTGGGTPLIGDIDGDGAPEVVVQNGDLRSYDYDAVAGLLPKWDIGTNDSSALTSLAMFDFNNDGRKELVYRDEANLRIINGSGTTAEDLATFPCASSTGTEMPVIADINGTGEARILVTCNVGVLRAYESGTDTPWADTRPVWNQQAYFATHINNDLSVPAPQFAHWTTFNDPGHVCSDGTNYPLNAFQQQITLISADTGCPVSCGQYEVEKISDPESGTGVSPGETINYTITIHNTGVYNLENLNFEDDLSDVLDQATITSEPKVEPSDTAEATLTDNILSVKGKLPIDETITLTYGVTVNQDAQAGGTLRNVIVGGSSNCAVNEATGEPTDSRCSTEHPVVGGLAATGQSILWYLAGAALLVFVGLGILFRRNTFHWFR